MKALIIEDDRDTRMYLRKKLEEKGWFVDEARDGKRGLFLAKTSTHDIVVVDYGLPEKNGFEICRELRDHKRTVPIVLVSVMSEVATKVEGLDAGADDYMTKPFFFDELYARMQALIRRPRDYREPVIRIDDLIIDVRAQRVARGKQGIHLTKKEFAILEQLARVPGHVVSKSELVEHAWEADHNLFSNTVETHILNLRKKIDSGKRKRLIHNVSGRGYKLDVKP